MKNLVFFLFFLSSVSVGAQIQDSAYSSITQNKSEVNIKIINKPDLEVIAAKQLYMQQCLANYAKQKGRGVQLSVGGAFVSVVGVANSNDAISLGGGVLSLVGFFVSINANKWMHRASIEPVQDGAVFKFRF